MYSNLLLRYDVFTNLFTIVIFFYRSMVQINVQIKCYHIYKYLLYSLICYFKFEIENFNYEKHG